MIDQGDLNDESARCLLGFAVFATGAQAQSLEELSERCGKLAAEVFQKKWGNGTLTSADGRTITSKYQSHYNSRLNKCLYLEVRDTSQTGKSAA